MKGREFAWIAGALGLTSAMRSLSYVFEERAGWAMAYAVMAGALVACAFIAWQESRP